jgi:hypothetical protein
MRRSASGWRRHAASFGGGRQSLIPGQQGKPAAHRKLQICCVVGRQSFATRQRDDLASSARGSFIVGRNRQFRNQLDARRDVGRRDAATSFRLQQNGIRTRRGLVFETPSQCCG